MTRPNPRRRTTFLRGAGALAAAALLAGCTSDEGGLAPVSPSVPVLQPGTPGEPNATLTGSAAAPGFTPTSSPTDARFFQEMIVHHAQALVMVESVLPDLRDPEVSGIASRIRDEQRPEIDAMASWLEGRGQSVPPEATNPNLTDHGAHAMPGMASREEISRLAAATGAEADRLFLTLMIRHHQGAIDMVEAHATNTSDPRVEETADDIAVTQTKQIAQMQGMLDRLT